MDEVLLEVKGLSFSYDKKPVLKNISLSVRRGEKIAVMGSNGAGKSTFFLNLNGVLQAGQGEIFFNGKRAGKKERKGLQRSVGFVFQDADSQLIASNVRAEISFGPMNMGLSKQEVAERVKEAIEYLSLSDLQDRPPHYLSGGEKKRVSIADILAMKPEIFLIDEPMAALDPMNAEKVEQILYRLNKEGKTLLVATHDVDFAYRFADRVLVFSDGCLIADGTPQEIFNLEEVMERAHLKKPSVMVIWEALIKARLVGGEGEYPLTSGQAAEKILELSGVFKE
ncbi:ABC transporter ATP-binding protein [bacterium D16-51]|nr:ABC transporter ATP-binding protein [bacterium D16-59]RKI62870.1 ABC transporter ATP-binding protein [bacterium D16-51]